MKVNSLDVLIIFFDIAHAKTIAIISTPEDRAFLVAQREEGCCDAMLSMDNVLAEKEKKQVHLAKQIEHRQKAAKAAECLEEISALDTDSSADDCTTAADKNQDQDSVPGTSCMIPSHPKHGRKELLAPTLPATLDRNKISDQAALMIVDETAKSLGHDITSLTLTRSSTAANNSSTEKINRNFL